MYQYLIAAILLITNVPLFAMEQHALPLTKINIVFLITNKTNRDFKITTPHEHLLLQIPAHAQNLKFARPIALHQTVSIKQQKTLLGEHQVFLLHDVQKNQHYEFVLNQKIVQKGQSSFKADLSVLVETYKKWQFKGKNDFSQKQELSYLPTYFDYVIYLLLKGDDLEQADIDISGSYK